MKANIFLIAVSAALAGCQTEPPPVAPTPAPLLPAPLVAPLAARVPEVVKTYTLGAYVDPDDPTLRHEAHTVQRIVSPAHWNLAPGAPRTITARVDPLPTPLNPVPPAAPPLLPAGVAQLSTTTPAPALEPEPAISPNASGVIDLTAPLGNETAETNPFAVRKVSADSVREISLQLSGIALGARPCAVINDVVVEAGAVIEGLIVRRIEPAAVVLQAGERRLRLPLSDQPTRVRVAF